MSGYGPDINQNWSGSSFVPGDGCSQSGDQQEASKTCIPGRLIIKLATEINNSFMSDDISINIETPMSLRTIVERIPIGLDVYAESSDPLKETWENFVLPHVNKEDLDLLKTICDKENICCDTLGTINDTGVIVVKYNNSTIVDLPLQERASSSVN